MAIFTFVFFIGLILCLIIALIARHELIQSQWDNLHQFNTGQVESIEAVPKEIFPKYAMAVDVEKIGSSDDVPEAVPFSRI